MNFATQTKNILLHDIDEMAQCPSLFAQHPEKDFTRTRKMGFRDLMTFLISMEAGSTRHELLKFYDFDPDTLSNPAFIQQRNKLAPNTMPTLFRLFNSHFTPILYRNRYQLLACDGTTFTFTRNEKDPDAYFPPNGKSTRGLSQIFLVALFDILSKRYVDAVIQPIRKRNEFQALSEMIDNFGSQSSQSPIPIFIADRGFHSYNVFAHAIENNSFFIIRATDAKMERLLGDDIPSNDVFDVSVTRFLSRSQSKKKRKHPELASQYRHICQDVPFDYIHAGTSQEYTINLRVLRIEVSEGKYENIITNLPATSFSADDIKDLYHLRWDIETSFCKLKHVIGAGNFHSKKRKFIEHEIWARLILFNYCSIITEHVVIRKKKRKFLWQVNYTVAYQACRHFLRLKTGENPPNIEGLIAKNTLPIRPDRNYARIHRFQIPVSFTYRF